MRPQSPHSRSHAHTQAPYAGVVGQHEATDSVAGGYVGGLFGQGHLQACAGIAQVERHVKGKLKLGNSFRDSARLPTLWLVGTKGDILHRAAYRGHVRGQAHTHASLSQRCLEVDKRAGRAFCPTCLPVSLCVWAWHVYVWDC